MSEEEDDELQALRLAALASLNKPRIQNRDVENLDTLRRAALQSRKDEGSIFEKLQPPKSSNLINLTPDPKEVLLAPAKQNDKFNRKNSEDSDTSDSEASASSNDPESNVSSTSSDGQSDSESSTQDDLENKTDTQKEKIDDRSGVAERLKSVDEDDDILNAIDQFLGGDFEIPEKNIPSPKEKQLVADKKPKPKVKKRTKKKLTKKKVKTEPIKKDREKKISDIDVGKKQESDHQLVKRETVNKRKPAVPVNPLASSKPKELQQRKTSARNRRAGSGGDDSVHSSDLSFLSDSSGDESPAKLTRPIGDSQSGGMTVTNRARSDSKKFSQSSRSGVISLKTAATKTEPRSMDLRKKLEEKGMPRNHTKDENRDPLPSSRDEGQSETRRQPSIFVKSSLADKANLEKYRKVSGENEKEKIFITRNITNEHFTKKSVRLKPETQSKTSAKSVSNHENGKKEIKKERKRSVLHFAPHTPVSERREKIARLMESAPKLARRKSVREDEEEKAFSDIGEQDFEQFEIAEDFDTEITENSNAASDDKDDSTPSKQRVDTRVFISASRTSDASSLSSGEIEDISDPPPNQEETPPPRRPVKKRLSVHIKSVARKDDILPKTEVDARTKMSGMNRKKRKRGGDLQWEEKNILSESKTDDDFVVKSGRDDKISSSIIATTIPTKILPVLASEGSHQRRKRRKVDLSMNQKRTRINVETLNARNVKDRLGGSVPKSKRRASPDVVAQGRDATSEREKELDERMRRIREQNEAILKRRQEIELEEKRFRLT